MNRTEFLRRLIGIAGFVFLSVPEIQASQKIYLLQSFVAGFRFHKGMQLLPYMQQGDILELRREPDNKHDEFAVALYWQQEMIGFLPASSNEIIARLADAKALPLVACITHLNQNAKPWKNVAIAVYFLQQEKKELPEYLTIIEQPVYTTVKKKAVQQKKKTLPHVLDHYDRVIAVDDVPDEAAKAY